MSILAQAPLVARLLALALLLLVVFYFAENRPARVACLALLILWLVWILEDVVTSRQWALLTFPALVIIAWVWISEVKRISG